MKEKTKSTFFDLDMETHKLGEQKKATGNQSNQI